MGFLSNLVGANDYKTAKLKKGRKRTELILSGISKDIGLSLTLPLLVITTPEIVIPLIVTSIVANVVGQGLEEKAINNKLSAKSLIESGGIQATLAGSGYLLGKGIGSFLGRNVSEGVNDSDYTYESFLGSEYLNDSDNTHISEFMDRTSNDNLQRESWRLSPQTEYKTDLALQNAITDNYFLDLNPRIDDILTEQEYKREDYQVFQSFSDETNTETELSSMITKKYEFKSLFPILIRPFLTRKFLKKLVLEKKYFEYIPVDHPTRDYDPWYYRYLYNKSLKGNIDFNQDKKFPRPTILEKTFNSYFDKTIYGDKVKLQVKNNRQWNNWNYSSD